MENRRETVRTGHLRSHTIFPGSGKLGGGLTKSFHTGNTFKTLTCLLGSEEDTQGL